MKTLTVAVQAGLLLSGALAFPCVMLIVTGGVKFAPALLLPWTAYVSVRYQGRIAATLAAARRAWAANAEID